MSDSQRYLLITSFLCINKDLVLKLIHCSDGGLKGTDVNRAVSLKLRRELMMLMMMMMMMMMMMIRT